MEYSKQPQKYKKKDNKLQSVYSRCLVTRNIVLPITAIGKNIRQTIEENIKDNFESKCVVEGYIKPNSSKIITYSSGLVQGGSNVSFEVVFECMVCFPVENMLISYVKTLPESLKTQFPNASIINFDSLLNEGLTNVKSYLAKAKTMNYVVVLSIVISLAIFLIIFV